MPATDLRNEVGVVAIGRNEGERLERCLRSCVGGVAAVVYVDSGSTDGSVALAHGLGVEVVELDTSVPFTAARARNTGARHLMQRHPNVRYLQFIDGDCEVADGWLAAAAARLDERPELAVVCGRRRERHPEASIYNRLIDLEWDTPIGDARACGGDAMMRREAFEQVGGYNEALICGEEPELCVRLRAAGFKVERIDREMTLHDAAMTRFGQWWKRAVRGGWAYAEGAAMHGGPPERHNVRAARSILFWAMLIPLMTVALLIPSRGGSLLLLLGYPLLAWRVVRWQRRRGMPASQAWAYAASCVLGKFPELIGMCRYWLHRRRGGRATLIEYKTARAEATTE